MVVNQLLGESADAAWVHRIAKAHVDIDNLLVRIHFIIVMIRWIGLAPWEFEIPFPGSLASTFLVGAGTTQGPRGVTLHGHPKDVLRKSVRPNL